MKTGQDDDDARWKNYAHLPSTPHNSPPNMGTLSRNTQNQVQPPAHQTQVALTTPVLLGLFESTAAVHVAQEPAKNIKCRTIVREGEEGQEDSKSTNGVNGIHS